MSKFVKVKTKGVCETNKAALNLIRQLKNESAEELFDGFSQNCCPYVIGLGVIEMYRYFGIQRGTRLSHYVLFFDPTEISDFQTAVDIARDICAFISKNYQTLFYVHSRRGRMHIHFLVNNFNCFNGKRNNKLSASYEAILEIVRRVQKHYGVQELFYLSKEYKQDNSIASEVTVIDVG